MLNAGCSHGASHAVMVSNSRRAGACSMRSAQGSFSKEMANFRRAYSSVRLAASRSEEHTSELQSLMRISYAVFCLKKKKCLERRQQHIDTVIAIQNQQHNT